MALSIKTDDADRLARQLAALTGETMTEAVTRALQDRLERLREARDGDLAARIMATTKKIAQNYDLSRPVTREEWDGACGDAPEERAF